MEETIIHHENVPEAEPGVLLTPQALYYLNEGAGWAKFLSIMGFIACGLMILGGLFAGTLFSYIGKLSPNPYATPASSIAGTMIGIIYIGIAVIYFFPSYYLYKFATAAKQGVASYDSDELTVAVEKLKSCFKFWGILTIVILSIYALCFIGLIAGIYGASHMR